MDFAVWSILELDVLTSSHPKIDSLNADIQSDWSKLNEEVMQRSCASVKVRLKLMFKAKGGDF